MSGRFVAAFARTRGHPDFARTLASAATASAMIRDVQPGIVVVTRKTRLRGVLARWATRGQAQFMLAQATVHEHARQGQAVTQSVLRAANQQFGELESEDATYQRVVETLERELDLGLPVQFIDRDYLPTFDFGRYQVVVVVGQDGLVANTAKYVGSLPIVAVNPDPQRIDGVLLPFQTSQARRAVNEVLDGQHRTRDVTLAEVNLADGQRLLAFNDLFIGCASHVSARYELRVGRHAEPQSSSGIIVSTGAGSTGWFSSVVNMARGIGNWLGAAPPQPSTQAWEDRSLLWVVREPFVSKSSSAEHIAGRLPEGQELIIESRMSSGGVIFSDGVESDFLEFNAGTIARITVAQQRARLVWPYQ